MRSVQPGMMKKVGAAALLVAGLLLAALPAVAQGEEERPSGPRVDEVRTTLEEWVATRRLISEEKRTHRLQIATLEDRKAIVEAEIASLRERIAERRKEVEANRGDIEKLEREKGELEQATQALAERVRPLEERVLKLLGWLPEPLMERVRPLSQRIPTSDEEADGERLTLGMRFQNIVGIVNAVNKFNGEVTESTEIRELASGKSALVRTVYLGLGQAYFVSANGQTAGVGRPGEDGWVWVLRPEIKERVSQVVQVLANAIPAVYTRLPVEIR